MSNAIDDEIIRLIRLVNDSNLALVGCKTHEEFVTNFKKTMSHLRELMAVMETALNLLESGAAEAELEA